MAVLDNLGFLSWLHQDGHLSEGGNYARTTNKYKSGVLHLRS